MPKPQQHKQLELNDYVSAPHTKWPTLKRSNGELVDITAANKHTSSTNHRTTNSIVLIGGDLHNTVTEHVRETTQRTAEIKKRDNRWNWNMELK